MTIRDINTESLASLEETQVTNIIIIIIIITIRVSHSLELQWLLVHLGCRFSLLATTHTDTHTHTHTHSSHYSSLSQSHLTQRSIHRSCHSWTTQQSINQSINQSIIHIVFFTTNTRQQWHPVCKDTSQSSKFQRIFQWRPA